MSSNQEVYEALCAMAAKNVPGFKVGYKTDSKFMKLLGFLSKPFCPTYMTTYTTTFGKTVYFPSREFVESNYARAWQVMAHEYCHLIDWTSNPIKFVVGYSLPQGAALLALLAIGAFWNTWWLLSLLAIFALLPWPAPGRYYWELRGYTMSMATIHWVNGDVPVSTIKWIAEGPLSGWGYYKMGWSEETALRNVYSQLYRIKTGEILTTSETKKNPFSDVYDLLKSIGAVKN